MKNPSFDRLSNPDTSNKTDSTSATSVHLDYLDGIRALAALYVLFHHSYLEVKDFEIHHNRPLSGFASWWGIFTGGHFAVSIFIVLSGFCLMIPVVRGNGRLKHGNLDFFTRRAWRILPPYYFALIGSLLLIQFLIHDKSGTHWDSSLPVTSKSIWTHLLLVHDIFRENGTINHVFWSIAVEWRIYFFFPLLLWAWRYFGAWPASAMTIAGSFAVFQVLDCFFGRTPTVHYLGLFAMGMLGASIIFSPADACARMKNWPWGWLALLIAGIFIGLQCGCAYHALNLSILILDCLVGIATMAVLVHSSLHPEGPLCRALSYRPLVFIGTFSYSIYLIHAPLIEVLWRYPLFPLQSSPYAMLLALTFCGAPLIVAFSYVFYWFCEKPFIRSGSSKRNAAPSG